MATRVLGLRGWAMTAFVAAAAVLGAAAVVSSRVIAASQAERDAVYVELGQFTAPIQRLDGSRGFLLIQARAAVADQNVALQISSANPVTRHAGLRAVYSLAAQGEIGLDIDGAALMLRDALNQALGAELVETVYVDRLLVQ